MKKSKKLLALLTALSISATAFAGLATTAFAEGDPYFSLDFENETSGQVADKDALGNALTTMTLSDGTAWTSQYDAGGMSIATNSAEESINQYYKYGNTSGSGQRTSYYTLPDAAKTLDEAKKAVMEFDFMMGGNSGGSQLIITDSSAPNAPIGNGAYTGSYVFSFYQSDKDTIVVNSLDGSDKTYVTTGYSAATWAHAKAVMDFDARTVVLTITSLDGTTKYFEENMVGMGTADGESIKHIFIGQPRNIGGLAGVDNIVVRPYADGDVLGKYFIATFDVEGTKTTKTADKDTGLISEVPETAKTGYVFDGWYKDDDTETVISTEDVLSTPLTANTVYTAVYHKDPEYIEPMTDISLVVPNGGLLTMGESDTDFASNEISVKVTGELGSDLYEQGETRVAPIDVKWTFSGFNTMFTGDGTSKPTDSDQKDADGNYLTYCDTYAKVVYDEENPTVANFTLANQASNFYGKVKVEVTYYGGGEDTSKTITLTQEKPLTILANKAQVTGQILPKPGYVSDFSWYEDSMVDFKVSDSPDNRSADDITTGDWAAYGGNSGKGLYIRKEGDEKFLQLYSTGTNSSSFATNQLDAAPTEQVIIKQDVRFYNNNSAILFKSVNPPTWTPAGAATTLSLNFSGTALTMNGQATVAPASPGVWYTIVLSCDVTSGLWYAKVYDRETGALLGESDIEPFVDAGSLTPTFLCYRTPDNSQGTLDFNNVIMYTPEIAGDLTTTIESETVAIPETADEEASSTQLSVSALSTEGYDIISAAEWSIVSDAEDPNVVITPDENNSHMATLSVKYGAQAADIKVRVSMGGKTKDIPVRISGSSDSVNFTKSYSSISIPLQEGQVDSYVYEAKVQDKNLQDIAGKAVTYAVYDKNNANELTTLPEGITFDKDTATLTVSEKASATVLYIRASGTNSKDEPISRSVKVTIHGLSFDLGSDADDAVAEGYTAVTPNTPYSDSTGYGIESGSGTEGGTASADNADSDNIDGTFKFQAKVEPKKVYNVTINYMGTVASEYVNADLSGRTLTNTAQTAVTYVIPVIDDVLDLSFSRATVSSIVIEKQADKGPGVKPNIYTIGDSTIANNGSWAYNLARDIANYPDLMNIASFSNNGRGGRNLSSYYTNGELADRVLSQVRPGDYVMIGDMGTNGMGTTFEEDFNYYIDACEALGAKIILNSYTPHGAVGDYANGYNKDTHTFTSYRQDAYDNIVRNIFIERTTKPPVGDDTSIGIHDVDGKFTLVSDKAYDKAVVIAADYSGDKLTNVTATEKAIAAGVNDLGIESAENRKIFIWDSLDEMKPLFDAAGSSENENKYDPNVVGFVDIGKMADAAFNAYVAEGADDAAKEARAQEIISCFSDHNHYGANATHPQLAGNLMIGGYGTGDDAKGIVKTLVDIITNDLSQAAE